MTTEAIGVKDLKMKFSSIWNRVPNFETGSSELRIVDSQDLIRTARKDLSVKKGIIEKIGEGKNIRYRLCRKIPERKESNPRVIIQKYRMNSVRLNKINCLIVVK